MDAEYVVLLERVGEEVVLGHLDALGETDPDLDALEHLEEDTVALKEDRLHTCNAHHQKRKRK